MTMAGPPIRRVGERRGNEAYARTSDVPEKDVWAAMVGRVGAVFAEEAFMSAGGPAWSHQAITNRERSIVIITALIAQGVAGDRRLDSHIRLAQRNDLEYEALTAVMTLMTNYIGYAHGSQAMEAVQRVAGSGTSTSAPNS
jgi:4-carboxymuconolactone decarboxylase